MSELPKGWVTACISDVADLNPKQNFDDDLAAGFVPMSHAPTNFRNKLRFDDRNWGDIKKAYTNFKDGDVIFAKVTPCFENGKAAFVEGLPNGIGAGSSEFFVLRPCNEEISAKYLLALVKSRGFMREGALNMTGAVGLRRVPKHFVESYPMLVPPAVEQVRISQKLDEVLDQVDTLKARIGVIHALLKRFRQSVLVAAVSGRLTEEWRRTFCEFEEGPVSLKLSDVALEIVDCPHSTPKWQSHGKKCVRTTEFSPGFLDVDAAGFVSEETFAERTKRTKPTEGDILYAREGTVGIACSIPPNVEICMGQRMVLIRAGTRVHPTYLLHTLNSEITLSKVRSLIMGSTAPRVNVKDLKNFEILVPSLEEQTEIIRRVEQLFAVADQLEGKVVSAKSRIDHLTQSILAKAFRGELVPQDPNDEPASVLLERIKAQRAVAPKAKRGRKIA
ncbi:restriction endonuclease subunit S [Pseudomonas sp. MDT1-17]